MNPIVQGLKQYKDLRLPISYSSFGGQQPEFIPSGTTPTYKNSTIMRNKRPKGRPKKAKVVEPVEPVEGGVNLEDVKKTAKKVGKKVAPIAKAVAPDVLDMAFDLGAQALAVPLSEVMGPSANVVTKMASKAARKAVKAKFGYGKPNITKPQPVKRGRKPKMSVDKDVGVYDGGFQKKMGHKIDKRKMRGKLIQKLMKEKGMSLAESSKYIKENNLM